MPLSGGGAAPEHNKGTADTGGDREESLRRVFPAPPPPAAPHPSTLIYFYLFLAGSGALARRGAAAPL